MTEHLISCILLLIPASWMIVCGGLITIEGITDFSSGNLLKGFSKTVFGGFWISIDAVLGNVALHLPG